MIAAIVVEFAERLNRGGFEHLLGGSFASGTWGESRATNDADFSIWLSVDQIDDLIHALGDRYHLEGGEARAAIEGREEFAMFQVLDTEEAFKFDLFIAGRTSIDREAQGLARQIPLIPEHPVLTACPEHIFVLKLRWYEAGRRQSRQQWRDLIGIARTTRTLDRGLIARWSSEFGVRTLAEDILAQADHATPGSN